MSDFMSEYVIKGSWNINPKDMDIHKERLIMFDIPNTALIFDEEKLNPNFIIKGSMKKMQNKTPVTKRAVEVRTVVFMNFLSFSYNAGRIKSHIFFAI